MAPALSVGDSHEATIEVRASPEHCYDVVSDITAMGRLSPECTGGRWRGGATGPVVGARFIGTNRRGWVRWFTFNTVVAAEPGKKFAFETKDTNIRWSHLFNTKGEGCEVTERREVIGSRPPLARFFAGVLLGGVEEHEQEMIDGLEATLGRLKAVAEL